MGIKQAIKALFQKETIEVKEKDNRNNHTFTDEDREHSWEMRRLRQETARIQQKMQLMQQRKELEELKAELYDEDETEDDDNNDLMDMLSQIIMASRNNQGGNTFAGNEMNSNINNSPQSPSNPQQNRTFTDDDIRNFIKSQNKIYVKIAKKTDKNNLKEKIREKMPLTDADYERAYEILQKEF